MTDRTTVEGLLDTLRASHEVSAKFTPLQATIEAELPAAVAARASLSTVASSVVSSVEKFLSSVLAMPLTDILLGAWSKLEEVRELRGPTKRGEVTLASHTVTGDYRPKLSVRVSEPPAAWSRSWEFDLKIALALEAVTLGIDGGKIRTVTPCSAKLSVDLLCEGLELLKVAKAGPFDIGGHIRLGDGIPIP
jgi:hypothetical protein